MGEPERIVRAAVWHRGRTYSLPQPARHGDVLRWMAESYGLTQHGRHQGFVTDAERFVDRKEAVRIAKAAGQIVKPKWPPDLYSEDLW